MTPVGFISGKRSPSDLDVPNRASVPRYVSGSRDREESMYGLEFSVK